MARARWRSAMALGWRLLQEPSQPRDMQHHALLAARAPGLFDALVRELRLRLFAGRVRSLPSARCANLRQGPSPFFVRGLCTLGFGLVFAGVLAGSELGRSFRRLAWDGGVAHAAVPAVPGPRATAPVGTLLLAGAAGLGVGLLLVGAERKHFWLVSCPAAGGDGIDIWVAAGSGGDVTKFGREWDEFLRRAATLNQQLRSAPPDVAPRSALAPAIEMHATHAPVDCRGTGTAARP